jgi:hypothetical protein
MFMNRSFKLGGIQVSLWVYSSLVDMYAKCGTIENAWIMFNKMPIQNVVTWIAMVWAHVKCGQG